MTANWTSTGIAKDTPYQVVGQVHYASGSGAFGSIMLESGILMTVGGVEASAVVSTEKLNTVIGKFTFSVEWTVVLNPGQNGSKTLPMGTSGDHVVYQTWGKPRDTGKSPGVAGYKPEPGSPTVPRMELATNTFYNAWAVIVFGGGGGDPDKPARLIYTVIKMHAFNINNSIVHVGIDTVDENRAWLVPKYWTTPFPNPNFTVDTVGSNCISGALFTKRAALMVGLPGTIDTQQYAASGTNEQDAKHAIHIPDIRSAEDPGRVRVDNNGKIVQVAGHFSGDSFNYFEATILYTTGGTSTTPTTFYIPSGVNIDVVYDNSDDALTIFDTFEWAKYDSVRKKIVPLDTPDVIKKYKTVVGIPLTKLDE